MTGPSELTRTGPPDHTHLVELPDSSEYNAVWKPLPVQEDLFRELGPRNFPGENGLLVLFVLN